MSNLANHNEFEDMSVCSQSELAETKQQVRRCDLSLGLNSFLVIFWPLSFSETNKKTISKVEQTNFYESCPQATVTLSVILKAIYLSIAVYGKNAFCAHDFFFVCVAVPPLAIGKKLVSHHIASFQYWVLLILQWLQTAPLKSGSKASVFANKDLSILWRHSPAFQNQLDKN